MSSVAFCPDGRTLATGSADRTVWLWDGLDSDPDAAIRMICQAVHRDLTPVEWSAYLPGEPIRPVCSS